MFAVIKTGGKQYRVVAEDKLKIAKVAGKPGEIVEFGEVLVVGGDQTVLGSPTVAGATVAGEVLAQSREPTVIAFKKRRRKNSRRRRGQRQEFTLIRITEILTDGKKPSMTAKPRPQAKPKKAEAEAAPEAKETKAPAKTKGEKKPAAKSKAKSESAKKPAKGKSDGGKSGKGTAKSKK